MKMMSPRIESLCALLILLICYINVVESTKTKNIRFTKPYPYEPPENRSENGQPYTEEEKNERRQLGDDLMNVLFSGEFVDDVPMHRRTNGVASFLSTNENTMGSFSEFFRDHSSPDDYNKKSQVANSQDEKKLLVKEAVSVYKDYNEEDIKKRGMIQLQFLVTDWTEVIGNDPGNVDEPGGYKLFTGKLVDETGTNAGDIDGKCYIFPSQVENLCIFNLVVINDAGLEAGTLHVHGTVLGANVHASVFAVVGGSGVFAGAAGSAIWDEHVPSEAQYDNRWVITIYECWEHPVVEAETYY